MYTPTHAQRWTRPRGYFGESWPGHYSAGFGRSRDSGPLERANFRAALNALGFDAECPTYVVSNPNDPADDECPTRTIARENHWAVGWVEWIAIHESDTAALKIADRLLERIADYPILDEELHFEFEDTDCAETWTNCYDPRERLEYLRAHVWEGQKGVFRHALAAVRGSWHDAAQLLPDPSDILC